jgi:hypothetical protein
MKKGTTTVTHITCVAVHMKMTNVTGTDRNRGSWVVWHQEVRSGVAKSYFSSRKITLRYASRHGNSKNGCSSRGIVPVVPPNFKCAYADRRAQHAIDRQSAGSHRRIDDVNGSSWTLDHAQYSRRLAHSPSTGLRNPRSDTTQRRSGDIAPSIFLKPATATRHLI